MPDFDLNDEQKKVVNDVFGPILVLAPVGTGKTCVLAERVRRAIEKGIAPERILCLTFTNRAAGEMASRVKKHYPAVASKLTIKTFHGLCARMLRMEARFVGLPRDFSIFDDADSNELLRNLFGLDERQAKYLYFEIERAKTSSPAPGGAVFPIAGSGRRQAGRAAEGSLAHQIELYQDELRKMGALDFADLVCSARAMLQSSSEIRDRWQNRFDFIQVDEVQDTHASEYAILSILAERSRNIALIGDIDQTIYEWRGSEPDTILDMFRKEFAPVKAYDLAENYRATRILLGAVSAFAESLDDRRTSIRPAGSCGQGQPIGIHRARTESEEGAWIAAKIVRIAEERKIPFRRMAVLGRVNKRAIVISQELERRRVPCYTVELFEFFRRQEVKDALAWLRLLLCPEDRSSLVRVLLRPTRGIGEAAILRITTDGEHCGLRLTDLVSPLIERDGESYERLIREAEGGSLVVLDTETTGLSPARDEVVEIAAVRLDRGRLAETFHSFIRNTMPVGESFAIHGWSDDFLRRNGRPAGEVFRELARFIGRAPVVGYNIRFDLGMIRAHARRVGEATPELEIFDTWAISSRLLPDLYDYRLETVCKAMHVACPPRHKAEADVAATAELLIKLLPKLKEGAMERWRICARYAAQFAPLITLLTALKLDVETLRPAGLLERVLERSGLRAYYRGKREERRLEHLERLAAIFLEKDDPTLAPQEALAGLLEYAALAKNVDHILEEDNKVPIITIHQAKGLEFDVVFIAGAADGEIPSYLSERDGRLEEEKRLFYVAMTRAKQELYISSYASDENGRPKSPSRFLSAIPVRLTEKI
jgi:DNA helicase-2/ATP-dependent DNA helicase PcrA